MSNADLIDTVATAGAAIEQAVAVFMLHPETYGGSIAAGYQNPLAGYVAGRGGVLGEATGATVSAVFAVFEPVGLAAMWDEGVAVHGAARASEIYWDQTAEFGRKYLSGAEGLDRIAGLGEKLIASTPITALPLIAGEFYSLLEDERTRMSQIAVETASGRCPVVIGVSSPCVQLSLKLAKDAE